MSARPILLKLSGEALKGEADGPFDLTIIDRVCAEVVAGVEAGRQVAIVVGGGNIIRGATLADHNDDPTAGDYMGMLATLVNSLALRDGILRAGGRASVIAPHQIPNVCRQYDRGEVMKLLIAGEVVIFGGGTGHPFLTTDTTAALRAAEIEASAVLKGSKVDGVYDKDPARHSDAKRFDSLTFDEAIAGRYAVMDQTAFTLCRDRGVAIRVFAMTEPGSITAALGDNPPGTIIGA